MYKPKKRYVGRLFSINRDNGYGFITSRDEDLKFEKIFFHWTALKNGTTPFKELERKMELEFEVINYVDKTGNEKGLRAINIWVLDPEDSNDKGTVVGTVESNPKD